MYLTAFGAAAHLRVNRLLITTTVAVPRGSFVPMIVEADRHESRTAYGGA